MLIVGLLSIEQRQDGARCADCPALDKTLHRVRAMAAVHEHLSRAAAETPRDLTAWLQQLAGEVFQVHGLQPDELQLEVRAELPGLPAGMVMPCALIINELLTNCLKHAFPPDHKWAADEKPTVRLELRTTAEGRLRLSVADNGVGLPAGVEVGASAGGWQLVQLLAGPLGGRLQVAVDRGTVAWVEFPVDQRRGVQV